MPTALTIKENDTDAYEYRHMTWAGLMIGLKRTDGSTYERLLEGHEIIQHLLSERERIDAFAADVERDKESVHTAYQEGEKFLRDACELLPHREIYVMSVRLFDTCRGHDWFLQRFGLSMLPEVKEMKADGEWEYMIGEYHLQFFTAEGMRNGLSGRELERYAVKRLSTRDAQELLEDAVAKVEWDFESWQHRYEPSDSVEA